MTPKHITDRDAGTLTYDFNHAASLWMRYSEEADRVPYLLGKTNDAFERVKIDYLGIVPMFVAASSDDHRDFDFWLECLWHCRSSVNDLLHEYLNYVGGNNAP